MLWAVRVASKRYHYNDVVIIIQDGSLKTGDND